MTSQVTRFGGVVIFPIAIAIGIAIGRVIEAAAIGAFALAIWTYVARFLAQPKSATQHGPNNGWDE